jgi:hypothetical protein
MKQVLRASVVGLLSVACGSSGNSDSDLPSVNAELEVLHQFSADGNEYEFLYGGPDEFLLSTEGPLTAPALPELADGGPATLLETYLALAPKGETPHPKLVDYHLQEARVLGRPDNSVLQAKLNLDVPVEKSLESNLTACKTWASGRLPAADDGSWAKATHGITFAGNQTWNSPSTTLPNAAAACNIGGTGSFPYLKYYKYASASQWTFAGSGTLSANSKAAITWGVTSNPKQTSVVANNQTGGYGQLVSAWYLIP